MREDGFFEFERGNIFAAADDDVFLAIDDQHVAVFVERGHVSGVEPAAAQGFGGSFGLAPVAFHDAVTARDDFADGLPVVRHVVVVRIHDAHLHAGNRVAGHGLADMKRCSPSQSMPDFMGETESVGEVSVRP